MHYRVNGIFECESEIHRLMQRSVRLLNRLCIYAENLDIEMTTLEI